MKATYGRDGMRHSGSIYNGRMRAARNKHRITAVIALAVLVSACGSGREIGTTASPDLSGQSETRAQATHTGAPPTATRVLNCSDDASYIDDLSVPDGSQVSPGSPIDKRWRVANSGTCDWTSEYRLVPLQPNPLVGQSEEALYPAKAGSEAVLRVTFEAPMESGEYLGQWQAMNPEGQLFGDAVFLLVVVEESVEGAEVTEASP